MAAVYLRYDPSGVFVPSGELPPVLASQYASLLEGARRAILAAKSTKPLGWLDVPFDRVMLQRIKDAVAATRRFDTLLVLGIGGSDLGARAILRAVPHMRRVVFAGDTTDPDALAETLIALDLKKTLVNVISKSGDTLEPLSVFFVLRERLIKTVGKKFAAHIVATTAADHGTLHALAQQEGYHHLLVPEAVGGRFSVLSDVGLFPAAWAGVKVEGLLQGAAEQTKAFLHESPDRQVAGVYAAVHAESYQRYHRSNFVLMPYAHHLSEFTRWYRQLIAESLGKQLMRGSERVGIGPTPISALGPTDQHSQLQLYMDGPEDKIVTFIEVERFSSRMRVPRVPCRSHALTLLSGQSFENLIHAERLATAEAMAHAHRPNGTLFIPKLDAVTLGQLFQFFMLATAYLGELLHVNAYDQPGVEDSKRRFHAWLEGA